ncbi:MAG: tRNA uridine-5-carboxymethylaminomethyl(34) synthesis GTPase MnmE, partial [Clostridiales bacterium]|nr:tRNA uridine-5-carboxymethylaminomethyl(34) synthesis GTPase MnmE [Clostridiales bacterium]
ISDAIAEFFKMGSINPSENSIVTSERHVHLLESACDNIEQAIYMLEEGTALELVELNVRYAYEELGQIIGEAVGDEILDTVFSKFCLGK